MGWPHIQWSCYNVGEALGCSEVNTWTQVPNPVYSCLLQ